MLSLRTALRAMAGPMTGLAMVSAAPALAQAEVVMTEGEIQSLPPELRTGPVANNAEGQLLGETSETIIGEDGVETIVRTRYITPRTATRSIEPNNGYRNQGYPVAYYPPAPQPVVFEREQWLDECRRRTRDADNDDKGGIIGGLLGAIAGGIIGNRVSDGERLAGTLIGAGTGGLAGLAIGTLIGSGDRDDDEGYDCEASLDNYLNQYGEPGSAPRLASRTLPPAGGYPYPAYPAYAPAPAYYGYGGCNCAQPVQTVMVPVRYAQRQRVIVRENVREEMVPVRNRDIPAPAPRMTKQPTKVVPVPRPVKMIKN